MHGPHCIAFGHVRKCPSILEVVEPCIGPCDGRGYITFWRLSCPGRRSRKPLRRLSGRRYFKGHSEAFASILRYPSMLGSPLQSVLLRRHFLQSAARSSVANRTVARSGVAGSSAVSGNMTRQ